MLDSSRSLGHPSLCGLFSEKDLCEQKGCGGAGSFMVGKLALPQNMNQKR